MFRALQIFFIQHFTQYIKFYLIVTMIIWGVSWASSKVCVNYTDINTLLFLKFFLSVLAMFPFVVGDFKHIKMDLYLAKICALGIVFLIFYNIFFFKGLEVGYAAFGGVFVTTINPILTFFLVAFLTKISIPRFKKFGLFLGLIGGMIMLRLWDVSKDNLFDSGNIFFFLAAFGWSVVSIASGEGSKKINSMTLTFILLVGASCISFFWVPKNALLQIFTFDFYFWVHALIAFVLTTAFATTIYFKGVALIGASEASAYLFLVPVFAVVSSSVILGEKIAQTTIIGGLFAIIALYLISVKKKEKRHEI